MLLSNHLGFVLPLAGLCLGLSGCGGGGTTPPPKPGSTAAPTPAPSPGPTPAPGKYTPDALKDEILDLPGAANVPWRTFSGYIDVSPPGSIETRQMFYWFVESQNKPDTDPVILWTNGGPGCSGVSGFLSEQGPWRAAKCEAGTAHCQDGTTLATNEFSWNKISNMVFIEQPVGVGFSTPVLSYYGDDQAAADNHRFVTGFFKRYSQYKAQDFYLSSESYGGHYLPTLAKAIKQAGDVPQFRGVFLGNPLSDMKYRNYGQYGTAWGHQLLPKPLWSKYEAANCALTFPVSDLCSNITGEMDGILSVFDPYALDFPTCATTAAVGRHERFALRSAILKAHASAKGVQLAAPAPYEPCIVDFMTKYLNRADVRTAIHVKSSANWSECSNAVGDKYNSTDVNQPMMPLWKELIKLGDLNIMILSGDDDSVCATLGTQQFIWDLGYSATADKYWVPWQVPGHDQVAGFRTDFTVPSPKGLGGFAFATVHSAGHMVPATQPARSLALLQAFLTPYTPKDGAATLVI